MTARTFMLVAFLLALGTSACQQEGNQSDAIDDVKDAASNLAESAEDLASAVGDLSKEKVEELAKIAAKFENAPEEAQKMLEEHGWSKEEFDKMVSAVKSNDELNKIFEAAKEMAGH